MAQETGSWFYDEDGFGGADSPERLCPAPWRAGCSGDADEGCSSCPCFAQADIDASYQAFMATAWDSSELVCEDWTVIETGYFYD